MVMASIYSNIRSYYKIITSKAAHMLMDNYLYACLCRYILFKIVPVQCLPNHSQDWGLKINDGQSLSSKMIHVAESGVLCVRETDRQTGTDSLSVLGKR